MAERRVCSAAETEFTDALCWYAERSRLIALEFDAEFSESITQICEFPERYPILDERHRFFLMRRFPYQLIYRWTNEQITLVAVATLPANLGIGRVGNWFLQLSITSG